MRKTSLLVLTMALVLVPLAPVVGQEKGTAGGVPALEELVPAGTMMIASFPDTAGMVREYRRTITGQMVEYIFSNDFQTLLRHVGVGGRRGGIPDFRKEMMDGIQKETGMTFEEILNIFDGECAIALVDVAMEMDPDQPPDRHMGPPIKVDFIMKLGWKDGAKGEKLLRSLLKKAPAKQEGEIAGYKTLLIEPNPIASPTFAFTPSCLIFGTQTETMKALLTALKAGKGIDKPLATNDEYALAMKNVQKNQASVLFYLNWERVANLQPVRMFLMAQAPDLIDDLGLDKLKSVASSFQVKDSQMKDLVFLRTAGDERKGVLKILSTPKTETKDGLLLTSSGDFSGLSMGGIYSPYMAIVAAIAVPSLMKSQLAANEKSAIGSLKSIREMSVMFRVSDDDRNTINDYWTADVSGLYRVLNAAGTEICRIEIPLAMADGAPIAEIANYVGAPLAKTPTPKAGYFFRAMTTDEDGKPYNQNSIYGTDTKALNNSKFAFCAYPAEYDNTGKNIYIVSQDGTIWRKDCGNNTPILTWPGDNPYKVGWLSID